MSVQTYVFTVRKDGNIVGTITLKGITTKSPNFENRDVLYY